MEVQYEYYFKITPTFFNLFTIILGLSLLIILFLRFAYSRRYLMNIYKPNVYLFEYESQKKYIFSIYFILNIIVKLFSLILISLSFYSFTKQLDTLHILLKTGIVSLMYFVYIIVAEPLFLLMIKKRKYYGDIIFVTNSFDNHLAFFLIIISFLIFYFPVKNHITLIISWIILFVFLITSMFTLRELINKHINFNKYQNFLYLCTSKILPISILIYWLIFQPV